MTETLTRTGGPDEVFRPARRGLAGPLLAVVACVLGVLGLVFGALPASDTDHPAAPHGGVVAGSIRVFGAYVREPASPDVAAAYLSIANDGSRPDTLLSVSSGAADTVILHDVVVAQSPAVTPGVGAGTAGADPGGTGSGAGTGNGAGTGDGGTDDDMTPTGPLTIPGGSTVTLAPTRGHLMLSGLAGTLRPGDQVSLLLSFRHAGQVLVTAPVVAIASPAPTQGGR